MVTGDIIFAIFTYLPLIIGIFIIIFIVLTVKKNGRRADERLKIERENMSVQQKKIDEMNQRLINIEKILKEVE
ncbi:hypothetical protein I6J18_00125 (plasmid) [Peribacillus psychrosaccharolyticus]|uniref:Uncharacterized protein n=1 Tax=Peribacillus psychrosaccharolyticus TaxID=1407 RepID=A0A974RZP2_PERPY|nr:hypothetical protein [Peribacillus psychrosaccharolyticus]MEC2054249.1 hypothetical protein [Peribacillus psychrosaccharolyticus]MED3742183.1 hypothetical protein [Peribacillus psychrosaccharolyticus]QQS98449.1 hypothetical protein I6J18_00125 [Peribacillus psychrosaccharolyticus]